MLWGAAREDDMRVLRLCSVYEVPPKALTRAQGFDAIGGMQVHTARLTSALDALGVEQTVITAYRPGAPRVERVGVRSKVVRVGARLRHFRQLYGLASVPRVRGLRELDVVHVHLGEDLAILPLARWAASRTGSPLVVTLHCSLRHTLQGHDLRSTILRTVGGPSQSWLLRGASVVLVLTDRLAELLIGSGIPATRVRVVPMGIGLEATEPLPKPAWMDGRRWVVYVGRIVQEKGVRELVEAFTGLSVADAGLLIIGDGPDRAKVQADVGRFASADRIRFIGAVPNEDVHGYLQHAAVVVLPSWYEERGRVLLEAMAVGTPVVATRTGGIPATVRDGTNGLLVAPRDPRALAGAIDRVLGEDRLAASLGAAGRITASEQGIDGLVNATLETYEAVLHPSVDSPRTSLREPSAP